MYIKDATPPPKKKKKLLDTDGPLWYRWAYRKEETVCEEAEQVLAVTGTRRMIMGHTTNTKASSLIRDRNMCR